MEKSVTLVKEGTVELYLPSSYPQAHICVLVKANTESDSSSSSSSDDDRSTGICLGLTWPSR